MKISNETIRAAIKDSRIKAVSFDAFDTLLLRPFWEPRDLFYFLDREAARLLGSDDVVCFSRYRQEAEREARVHAAARGSEDVTLEEIYRVIEQKQLFSGQVIHALMTKEMELEERFCYQRKSAAELMAYAISLGKRVVVVSDMYLPSAFVAKLLEKNGFPNPEQVFVSCEIGLSKHTGHLYDYVLTQLGIGRGELLHIGDNLVSDYKAPKKRGIKAIPYYRTIDLLMGKNPRICAGKAFRYAYEQIRSPFSNKMSLDKLGVRCMLAVAANRIYDDPYRDYNRTGEYAGDQILFGNLALGMYCMAQALWLDRLTSETEYDRVLFFSRDSFLPYQGFCMLQGLKPSGVRADYLRISRNSTAPLILANEKRLICAGDYFRFEAHSPKSLARMMKQVLTDDAMVNLEKRLNTKWEKGFSTETEMMCFLKTLYDAYVDRGKMERTVAGFRNYFSRCMTGSVLTYDVGYHLRNESMLHFFFPDVKITAAFTHINDDLPIKRSLSEGIGLRLFYPSTPYVSWLPKERFLTERFPSCVGYSPEGEAVMSESDDSDALTARLQEQAAAYIKDFVSAFQEDLFWLPVEPADACLPMEAFLHSPTAKDKKWVRSLEVENSFESSLRLFNCQKYWEKARTDYWIAAHHCGRLERYSVLFLYYLFADPETLQSKLSKKMPDSVKRRLRPFRFRSNNKEGKG